MIDYKMGSSLVGVYTTCNIPPVENFKHGLQMTWMPTYQHFLLGKPYVAGQIFWATWNIWIISLVYGELQIEAIFRKKKRKRLNVSLHFVIIPIVVSNNLILGSNYWPTMAPLWIPLDYVACGSVVIRWNPHGSLWLVKMWIPLDHLEFGSQTTYMETNPN